MTKYISGYLFTGHHLTQDGLKSYQTGDNQIFTHPAEKMKLLIQTNCNIVVFTNLNVLSTDMKYR